MRKCVRTAGLAAGMSLVASMVTAGPSLATPNNDTTVHVNLERSTSRGSTIDLGSLLGSSLLGDSRLGDGRDDEGLSPDLGIDGLLRETTARPIGQSSLVSIDLGGEARPADRPNSDQGLSIRVDLGGVARSTGNGTEDIGDLLSIEVGNGSRQLLSIGSTDDRSSGSNGTGLLSGLNIDLGGNGRGLLGLGGGTNDTGLLGLGRGSDNGTGLLGLGSGGNGGGLLGLGSGGNGGTTATNVGGINLLGGIL